MSSSVIIVGSGFAGLSAASFMAKAGWQVTVIEKNTTPGGRAQQLNENGFSFDMGPSWYWMPDVFENYFEKFGKKVSDYYSLKRLDPSYRIYWDDCFTDIPADYDEFKKMVEDFEPGASEQLEKYLAEAAYKYEAGINKLVHKPGRSFTEFIDGDIFKGILRLDVFTSIKKHIHKYFKSPKLRQLMEFPVLFLGALPENTPALYSLMNYADIKGGTWYPQGGMYSVVKAMYELAIELGVKFYFNEEAEQIFIQNDRAKNLVTNRTVHEADVIISGADYHFTEEKLLPKKYRSYSETYWKKRVMAPSCLLYFVGLNKKLKNMIHHSLFFDVPFEQHAKEIYDDPQWPTNPLFYVSVNSVTDNTVAPAGCDNMVLLIPVSSGLENDDEITRDKYFQQIIRRMEKHTGQSILDAIIYKKTFSVSDFASEYNSFRGNAYGLANTLLQTAIFKPSCKSKKVKNLFYTGQLTVPGPGVPTCLISGEVVANEVIKEYGRSVKHPQDILINEEIERP
ncbi:MAG TPA: phytoene desaturase family protein [Chitinophagaceae bacterium]|nr:phytoene desaturase family protein [Chitinophagaceae bacterium]